MLTDIRLTFCAARLGIYSPCIPLLVGACQCPQLSATEAVGALWWCSSILLFHNPASIEATNISTLVCGLQQIPKVPIDLPAC